MGEQNLLTDEVPVIINRGVVYWCSECFPVELNKNILLKLY
jgi:hypothetical protein